MNSENKNDSAISVITNGTNPELNVVKCNDTTPNILPIDNKIAFLGKLCRNGHEYNSTGMSRRFVRDGRCSECRSVGRQKWYHANTEYANGLTNAWRENNREQSNASARLWWKQNPEKCRKNRFYCISKSWFKTRLINKKSQCKRSGLEFDLTPGFLEELWNKQNGKCYWLHIPIKLEQEKCNPLTATIERLDSTRGYTRDNVVWASYFANTGRRDCPSDEFKQIINAVKNALISA
jgi:hypothetical protein